MDPNTPVPAAIVLPDIKQVKIDGLRKFGLFATFFIAALLFGLMCSACFYIHSSEANNKAALTDIIIVTLGVACGWLAGTVSSPAAANEWLRFVKFGTAIGTFLSGYVLSKADGLISKMLMLSTWRNHPDAAFRVLLCVTGFMLALMITYVLRTSLLPPSAEDERSQTLDEIKIRGEILLELERIKLLINKINSNS